MLEDPTRCYDPGYAAGATLRRSNPSLTETMCEQGLAIRLESWAGYHFARVGEHDARYSQACRDHFRRGFRDGYWSRNRLRVAVLERVA